MGFIYKYVLIRKSQRSALAFSMAETMIDQRKGSRADVRGMAEARALTLREHSAKDPLSARHYCRNRG